MAALTEKFSTTWRDARGWTARNTFYVTGDTVLNVPNDWQAAAFTLIAALEALTNCALQSTSFNTGFGLITLTYGTNAEYPSAWMKALMQFSNGSTSIGRFLIPAPKIALFESDGTTIINDGTSAPVVAFVNAMKNADPSGTFVSDAAGLPWTHFEGGRFVGRKEPRRINMRVKSSHLVAGEEE